jgi:hypothetical protein
VSDQLEVENQIFLGWGAIFVLSRKRVLPSREPSRADPLVVAASTIGISLVTTTTTTTLHYTSAQVQDYGHNRKHRDQCDY